MQPGPMCGPTEAPTISIDMTWKAIGKCPV